MKTPRYIAFEVLYKIEYDDAYSSILINKTFREEKLSGIDSAFASALIYGVLEKRLTLDHIIRKHSSLRLKKIENKTLILLRMGAYQLLFMDKVPASAAVNESVVLAKKLKLYKSASFINAVLRSISRDEAALNFDSIKDKYEREAVRYSVPADIIKMWCKSYGESVTTGLLNVLDGRPPLYARVNTLKTDAELLIQTLTSEGITAKKTVLDTMLRLKDTGAVEKLNSFADGEFYIQDLSSNIAVTALSPKEGETVLDVCAAPGGKSFCAAMLMNNVGRIYANDLYPHRVNLISSTAKRLGIDIILPSVRDALDDHIRENVQTVICDVPCSGLGLMRRKPEIRYKQNLLDSSLPELQYKILSRASMALESGGRLMYSTCTLNPDENSLVVSRFLADNPDFYGEALQLPNGIRRTVREAAYECTLFPQTNDSDGFYFAVLRKH